MNTILIIYCFS